MRAKLRKINQYFKLIKDYIYYGHIPVDGISICPCGYKKDNTPPPLSVWITPPPSAQMAASA